MNKKSIIAVAVFVLVIALLAGVYFGTRPETQQGSKAVTVTVVHKDGSEKVFECQTDSEFLDMVLLDNNIVVGEMGEFGLYFLEADGEVADWNVDQGWWAIYVGDSETYADTGASGIPAIDGESYRVVYTIG